VTSRIANAIAVVSALGVTAFMIAALVGYANWPSRPSREIAAVFKSASFDARKNQARLIVNLQVELPDGRIAPALSTIGSAPQPGARIVLREHANFLGVAYLYWDGLLQDQNSPHD
jgi:hypothetical protein